MAGRLFDLLQVKPIEDTFGVHRKPPTLTAGEIILVDNVADYYFDFLPDNYEVGEPHEIPWDYDKHFPFISPPFDEMWFEFQTKKIKEIERVGVHVSGLEMTADEWDKLPEQLMQALTAIHGSELRSICKWMLFMTPYSEQANGVMRGPYGTYLLGVAEDGSIAKGPIGEHVYAINSSDPKIAAIMQPVLINPVLMALSFMHVKNAAMLRQTPAVPVTRHAKKKARKNPPTSRYYVLQINAIERGPGATGRAGGGGGGIGGGGGGEPSLHIVRGHFADYTTGNGLFGKHKGRFFVPAHLRGNPEVGVTEKDYVVK